jgi:putative membrane protein
MGDLLSDLYEWTAALHIVGVISWMAGLLYLPRLFVYHCGTAPGSEASEMLKVMERRLLKMIMTPAMIATFAFGIVLLVTPEVAEWSSGWLYAKLALVLVLAAAHGFMAKWRKDFEADRNGRPAKFYRIANEVPTVLMIAIVILVVVRPF